MTALDPGPRQEILGDHALFPGMVLPREREELLRAQQAERAAQDPVQRIRPRSPRPLTRESVAARVDVSPTLEVTERVQSIWDQGVRESRELAESLAALAPSWHGRDTGACTAEDAQCEDLLVAVALRCSDTVAYRRIRDGHRGVDLCPRIFARLRAGEFPAAWFRELLRRTLGLTDEEMTLVDATVSAWDPGITSEHFSRCLGTVVATLLERRELPPRLDVEARRRVEFEHGGDDGTACLRIVGPVPELLQLARRLDDAARTLQAAQRHALEAGVEVPWTRRAARPSRGGPSRCPSCATTC